MAPTVAIIIPVLNERIFIIDALQHVSYLGADEIIIVDGNSTDGTYELVKKRFPYVRCLRTECSNRAIQMNLGAREALSDILVFLHVDVRLPVDSMNTIRTKIQYGYIGGGFKKKYKPSTGVLNAYQFLLNNIYLGFLRNLVGTNVIFVRRDLFTTLKGFPEVDFMEDVVFAQVFKKAGRLAVISEPVIVSARRYKTNGVLKQIVRNARIIFGFQCLRHQPEQLKKVYTANA